MKLTKITILLLSFIAVFIFANSASAAVTMRPALNLGLVGYWPMDEGTGAIAGDFSGNRNDGTMGATGTIAHVQSTGNKSDAYDSSITATFGSNVTTGNLIVVTAFTGLGQTVSSVTDGLSNTYSEAVSAASGQFKIYYAENITGGADTVTANFSDGANFRAISIHEYSGADTTAPFDVGAGASSSRTGVASTDGNYTDNITTAVANELIVAATVNIPASWYGISPGTGLNERYDDADWFESEDKIKATAGTTNATWTPPNTDNYYWIVAAFKPAPAPATWVDGKRGKALSFDGTSDIINSGNNSSLNNPNSLTASAWIYADSFGGNSAGRIVNKTGSTDVVGWKFHVAASGHLAFTASWDNNTESIYRETADNSIILGAWNHVVVTWTGGKNYTTDIHIYVNGTEASYSAGDDSAGTTRDNDSAYPLYIGNRGDQSRGFDGTIDEVRVYNRALAPSEVEGLYETGAAKFLTPNNAGLVGSWSFEEGTGTKAGDSSGNGNDGTVLSKVAGDDFNRANTSPINGSWAKVPAMTNSIKVVSNQAAGFGDYASNAAYHTGTYDANQYAQVQVNAFASSYVLILLRVDTSTSDYYWVQFQPASSITFGKNTGATGTVFQAYNGSYVNDGDTVRAAVIGNTLYAYVNGSLLFTYDDTTAFRSSGKPGLYIRRTITYADDWEAGNSFGTWTDGKRGKALSFDGASNYVNVGDIDLSGNFTLSAWVKYDSLPADDRDLIMKWGTPAAPNTRSYMLAYQGSSLKPTLGRATNGSDPVWALGGTVLQTNTWYHIAGTYDGSYLRIYVNGQLDSNGSENPKVATGSLYLSNNSTVIGAASSAADGEVTDGLIDEVRIYNRALTPSEVEGLYASSGKITTINSSQNSRLTSGLVGLWSFDGQDIYGGTAYDRAGSNNGTISGATPAMGKVGQSLLFDGSNDYVQVTQNASINSLNTLTMSAWVYKKGNGGGTAGRISEKANAFRAFTDSSDGLQFEATRWTTDGGWATAASAITMNGWNHVVITYDYSSTANDPVFYVNGSVVSGSETATPAGTASAETSNLVIGDNGGQIRVFDGFIDEFRVYNRALSAAEVAQLYNMGK